MATVQLPGKIVPYDPSTSKGHHSCGLTSCISYFNDIENQMHHFMTGRCILQQGIFYCRKIHPAIQCMYCTEMVSGSKRKIYCNTTNFQNLKSLSQSTE